MRDGMSVPGLLKPRTAIEAALLSDPESAWEFLSARSAWDTTVAVHTSERDETSFRDSPRRSGEQTPMRPGTL
jgi:hypothetical protein